MLMDSRREAGISPCRQGWDAMKAHVSHQIHPMSPADRIPVVSTLVITLAAAFVAKQFWGSSLQVLFALNPYEVLNHSHFWRLGSYLFLHGDVLHLLLIIGGLYFFGRELELEWGSWVFLKYFVACGVGAGVCMVLLAPSSQFNSMGSSGALLGLLLGYALYFPKRTLFSSFRFETSMKAVLALYGALVLYISLQYTEKGIASLAPLGSLTVGFLYLNYYSLRCLTVRQLREYRAQQARKRYQVIDGGKIGTKGRRTHAENGRS